MFEATPLPPTGRELNDEHTQPSVLIVDDDMPPDDAFLRLLTRDGFDVECVQSGRAGLERGLGASWDAMLLDLHLPDIPAVQILEGLRREHVEYPIVAITGWYAGDDCEIAARRLGAHDFRRKPLDAEDVAACLRAAIAVFRTSVSGVAPPWVDGDTRAVAPRGSDEALTFQRLHARARLGDEAAREQILTQALPELTRRLHQRFRRAPRDLVVNAVEDALLDYVADPSRFDLARDVPLLAFLLQAANRNLINGLESDRRWHDRQSRYARDAAADTATHDRSDGPDSWEGRFSADDVTRDAGERQAFELWRGGERRTEAFAQVLGISARSPVEQAQGVKRFKDRLLKRIRRLFASTRGSRQR